MDIYEQLAELESKVYTTSETAELLHIGERSVRHAISDERLKAIKFKGSWLISFAALQDYVRANSSEVFAEAGEDARKAISQYLQLEISADELPNFRRTTRR